LVAVIKRPLPVIRPMRSEDIRSVMVVERAAYNYPWTEVILKDCLRVGYYCVVCEVNGLVVAHGIMSFGVRECHILNVCVHPDFQRNGIATQLIQYLLETAKWKRADIAFLEVRISNEGACKLYKHLGFAEIGIRKNYYPAKTGREDALILSLELSTYNRLPPRD
jgi:ribosomal-protein-alanine N-acetyltransferase